MIFWSFVTYENPSWHINIYIYIDICFGMKLFFFVIKDQYENLLQIVKPMVRVTASVRNSTSIIKLLLLLLVLLTTATCSMWLMDTASCINVGQMLRQSFCHLFLGFIETFFLRGRILGVDLESGIIYLVGSSSSSSWGSCDWRLG